MTNTLEEQQYKLKRLKAHLDSLIDYHDTLVAKNENQEIISELSSQINVMIKNYFNELEKCKTLGGKIL